ncbi:unnamed protein product [Heligmosomoides polygyrus]|uniref:GST N-terminal domain-containing protein n=1 Tax=Heligmosomoides polygyrus TaxID=6339 RepID=A0A3P8CDC1_HELPZ|nr:unnamed protein product [Heligmosomoides polygyrus]
MDFRIPHFVLHDFSDGEESKVIRMILTYARIPYECKVINRDDFILEDYPFHTLPVLEVNDRKLGYVPSICRQLGWRYALQIGEMGARVVGECTDFSELSGQKHGDDSEVDMIAEKAFEARIRLKNWLDHLDHREDHECDMTWCDLLVACLFNPIIYHCPWLFDRYPNVFLHNRRIAQMDEFAGFLYNVRGRQLG